MVVAQDVEVSTARYQRSQRSRTAEEFSRARGGVASVASARTQLDRRRLKILIIVMQMNVGDACAGLCGIDNGGCHNIDVVQKRADIAGRVARVKTKAAVVGAPTMMASYMANLLSERPPGK